MKSRAPIILLILAAAVGLGLFFGAVVPRFLPGTQQRQAYNTSTVLKQIQTLSDLVTVKYVMEKVVILEDVKWYGENRVLFLAHGIVKAGIKLGDLKPEDIRIEDKKISIRLPIERITDAYLDDAKSSVIERSTGLTRKFDKDLEQTARRQAVEDIRRAGREAGILKDARERAELQLKTILLELGFSDVQFLSPYK
jgi:hypothetical protein